MKTALFAGTFDPPTLGHRNIIFRCAPLFDKFFLGLAKNTVKNGTKFSLDERQEMLALMVRDLPRVEIAVIPELVVEFAKQRNVDCLVRAIRGHDDMDKEWAMAIANRQLSGIETFFIPTEPIYAHISSTLVKEIASCGGSLHGFVPASLESKIMDKFAK